MKCHGFSLLEYLIASILGLLLVGMVLQVYLSVKKTYQLQQALSLIEENGRFVTYFLTENIRLAGYSLCIDKNNPIQQADAIHGYTTANLPDFLRNNRIVKNTDILVIQRCDKMNNKEQHQFLKIAFFIGKTSYENALGLPIYALYEKKISSEGSVHTQEVVNGVENMQIRYGLTDTTQQNIATYRRAAQMQTTDWEKVNSVQIALLLNSMDHALSQPEPYEFDDKKFAADKQLHKEWDIYVALRERPGKR